MTADAVSAYVAPAIPVDEAIRSSRHTAAEVAARRHDAGYRDGYTEGWDAAAREVEAAIADHRRSAERLTQVAQALEEAVNDLRRRDEAALAEIESDMVALAYSLAEELVGRELAAAGEPVRESLRRAVRLLPDRGTPTVRVHPTDLETAREAAAEELVRWTPEVRIDADPLVTPGGCVVEIGDCRIDAQIDAALGRLRDALGVPSPGAGITDGRARGGRPADSAPLEADLLAHRTVPGTDPADLYG